MKDFIEKVDHPVIGVYDLDVARAAYSRLGFTVPPTGRHRQWGTANICIMLQNDYLEIRGIADDSLHLAGLKEFLEQGEGLMGVVFSTRSADRAYQAGLEAGIAVAEPRALERAVELPDRTLHLQFRNVMLRDEDVPGLTHSNLCEHVTPQLMRQSGWTTHANGAVAVKAAVGVVSDFDTARRKYERLLGESAVEAHGSGLRLAPGNAARIELIDREEASRRGVSREGRGSDYVASLEVGVSDLDVTERLLEANGVAATRAGDVIVVSPAETCGVLLRFGQM